MVTKIISTILSIIIMLSSLFPAFLGARNEDSFSEEDLAELRSLNDYLEYIHTNGVPSMATDVFLEALKPAASLRRLLNGRVFRLDESDYIPVSMNETLCEMCNYIRDNTGLDIVELLQHVPNMNGLPDFCRTALHLDTKNFRDEMYRLRDKAYAEDKHTLGALIYIFAAYFSVIEDVKIYTTPWKEDPEQMIVTLDVTFGDGEVQTMYAYLVIDPRTGHAHSIEEKGILKLGFDVDIYDMVLYATVNSWQRKFGFSILYDLFSDSNVIFNYITRRFKFDYAGKQWMIQIWKGNYGMVTNGAEVGIYTKEMGDPGLFYQCAADEDMMVMGFDLYHHDELLFTRAQTLHWWLNGFKISSVLYLPEDLTLDFTMEFPDEGLLSAFTSAVDAEHTDLSYTVEGLTFHGVW